VKNLAHVVLKDGESFNSLLKRFRKQVMRERILSDVRRKRYFVSKSEERNKALRKAIKRERRRQRKLRRKLRRWG
jgi:small subunit ribosomal protein S21